MGRFENLAFNQRQAAATAATAATAAAISSPKTTKLKGLSSSFMGEANSSYRNRAMSDGPVAIFWDLQNCGVPRDVSPEYVSRNIRKALKVHADIKGPIVTFSAYGDFTGFPIRLQEGLHNTGVQLVDVPNGRKDAADILVDIFLFAMDNPPPSSIVLISGDVDFARSLHVLCNRGYTIISVIPSNVDVEDAYALRYAGKFAWDWPSVARGECSVPADLSIMGEHVSESYDLQDEEAASLYSTDLSLVFYDELDG